MPILINMATLETREISDGEYIKMASQQNSGWPTPPEGWRWAHDLRTSEWVALLKRALETGKGGKK